MRFIIVPYCPLRSTAKLATIAEQGVRVGASAMSQQLVPALAAGERQARGEPMLASHSLKPELRL